jgi:ABC-type cobalamin/Fe3+-siderophores transport system ATPase subunit
MGAVVSQRVRAYQGFTHQIVIGGIHSGQFISQRELMALLTRLPVAQLIATHDLEFVVEICPRSIVLDGGRIVADGPTLELLDDEPLMLAHGLERPHILRHRHPH